MDASHIASVARGRWRRIRYVTAMSQRVA